MLNLFKTDEYINKKLVQKRKETQETKIISSTISKIALLRKFEEHYKIERFNFDFEKVDSNNMISEKFKELYSILFPKRTAKKYDTKYDLLKIYVNIIKNIIGDIPLIKCKKVGKAKKQTYFIDTEILKELIILAKNKNPVLKHYNTELIKSLTNIIPETKQNIDIYDKVDDDFDNFMYNKLNNKQGIYETPNINPLDDYISIENFDEYIKYIKK